MLMMILDNIAFAFFEVFLVTLVIHRLLAVREKKVLMRKLNMVIGTFFVEVGTDLARLCAGFDSGHGEIAKKLSTISSLSERDFDRLIKAMRLRANNVDYACGDIASMRDILAAKREFLVSLLANPILLEHESFTDLLWATFHLADELAHRKDLAALSQPDKNHIAGDINRVYGLVIGEWLAYMQHLKTAYPYLFSLALRTNPFDAAATAEVS